MSLKQSIHNEKVAAAREKLRRVLKNDDGKQALNEILGAEILWQNQATEKRERLPIVALLVPTYKARVGEAWDAVEKMIIASRDVCQVYIEPRHASSVVHWTRNSELAHLIKTRKPFDYVLFIDDDITPPVDALVKLLSHKKDFVGAACTVRRDPPLPNFRYFTESNMSYNTSISWEKNALIGGLDYGVGAGMILLSVNCLERVGEYYNNCVYEQKYFGLSGEKLDKLQTGRQQTINKTFDFWWFEFLKHPLGMGEYSEDLSFCFKCRELGIPIFIDTSVQPGHIGDYAYSLADYHGACQHAIVEESAQDMDILGLPEPEEIDSFVANPLLVDAPMQSA